MKKIIFSLLFFALIASVFAQTIEVSFVVVDTEQEVCYDENGNEITCPTESESFFGQDAQYDGNLPAYIDNGDGTVTDQNTGLVWQQSYNDGHVQYDDASSYCESLTTGGYSDWRLPTIKELFSIADFRGELVMPPGTSTPYIDVNYFDFEYPSMPFAGQFWSSNKYVKGPIQDTEIEGAFGFNFSDGHIKAYETGYYWDGSSGATAPGNMVRCVRGEENVYGVNNFQDNEDGTVSDLATDLMWQQSDDGTGRDWENALSYCESLELAGYDDWRLPNVKELQSIVDYDKTDWPAIDDVFTLTDWDSYYWTSTTHGDNKQYACYIAFGKAYSKDDASATTYYDWHGAGAMRSDPKYGNPEDYDLSSQNATDLVRIDNYARCVRDIEESTQINNSMQGEILNAYPNPSSDYVIINIDNFDQTQKFKLQVMNQIGQVVYDNEFDYTKIKLSIDDFGSAGTYFIKILDKQGTLLDTRKLILQ